VLLAALLMPTTLLYHLRRSIASSHFLGLTQAQAAIDHAMLRMTQDGGSCLHLHLNQMERVMLDLRQHTPRVLTLIEQCTTLANPRKAAPWSDRNPNLPAKIAALLNQLAKQSSLPPDKFMHLLSREIDQALLNHSGLWQGTLCQQWLEQSRLAAQGKPTEPTILQGPKSEVEDVRALAGSR
jgi:hypothetical protein